VPGAFPFPRGRAERRSLRKEEPDDVELDEHTMRHVIAIIFGLLCLCQTGCKHAPFGTSVSNYSFSVSDRADTPAFRLQRDADLVVAFFDWSDLRIWQPSTCSNQHQMTRATFVQSLNSFPDLDRNLVVVVMDKRWSVAQSRVSLDEMEHFMTDLGFRRIVFQQARSARVDGVGFPILRDTQSGR
jgi:hypothetical protein